MDVQDAQFALQQVLAWAKTDNADARALYVVLSKVARHNRTVGDVQLIKGEKDGVEWWIVGYEDRWYLIGPKTFAGPYQSKDKAVAVAKRKSVTVGPDTAHTRRPKEKDDAGEVQTKDV